MQPIEPVLTTDPAPDYQRMTDPELIAACLREDKLAWETLIRRYSRLIYATAIQSNLAPEDAGDVFQHVCIALLQQLSSLRDQTRLSAWLITLTRRKAYRLRKLRQKDLAQFDPLLASEMDIPDASTAPLDHEMLRLERQHQIRQAITTLGEKCQTLIRLQYYEDQAWTHEQIAEALAVSVASIGRMRERCLKRLKSALVARGFKVN